MIVDWRFRLRGSATQRKSEQCGERECEELSWTLVWEGESASYKEEERTSIEEEEVRTNLHKIYKDVVKILHVKLFVHKFLTYYKNMVLSLL